MSGEHRASDVDHQIFDHWNLADDDSLDSLRSIEAPRPRGGRKPGAPSTKVVRDAAEGSSRLEFECSAVVQGFDVDSGRPDDPSRKARGGAEVTCLYDPDAGFVADGQPAFDAPSRSSALPRPGDEFRGFHLVLELGRGAFARVFLAEEVNLGRRLVALKVSKAEGDEPQILARLQHAHIVPVHSVHDDPTTGLRLLCMPFLGGANLAQVLEESCGVNNARATGRGLVEALDQISQRLPPRVGESLSMNRGSIGRAASRVRSTTSRRIVRCDPGVMNPSGGPDTSEDGRPVEKGRRPSLRLPSLRSILARIAGAGPEAAASAVDDHEELLPCRRFLRAADSVRASVWIVARLAEGLEHAHSRGLLHRDLKPSNVLIAADGTPMLLDFNLAVAVKTGSEAAAQELDRAMLGGTLPYMSPEHLDAFDPEGTTAVEAVDERSDMYSLGLILFEMIAGEPAFDPPPSGSPSLQVLRRMVQERRGAPAPSLRERRPDVPPSLDALVSQCLDPDPNRRYDNAGDLAEDLRRFLDDLPMKHCPEPSLAERAGKWARRHPMICGSTTIITAAMVLVVLLGLAAVQAYEGMQGLRSRLLLRVFQHDALECRFLLNTFGRDDAPLRKGIALAESTLRGVRVDEGDASDAEDGAAHHRPLAPWISRLGPREREEVRRAIVELTMQLAHARVILASRRGDERGRRAALEGAIVQLDRIEATTARPPSVLYRQRARYRAALGDAEGSASDRKRAEASPPSTSHEWTMLGAFLLASGDASAAEQALREAVARDVTSFWAWFNLGHCHFDQGRFAEAVSDFTACVVARPEFAWAHFNRGLALARAGRPREAKDAFSAAIARDAELAEAFVDRGLVELELDQPASAEADLRKGMDRGRRDAAVVAALADALTRQGKAAEADELFAGAIARSPRDATLRVARGITRLKTDPTRAAADFAAVLDDRPRHALAHYGMACVLRSTDAARAIEHLDLALQADPNLLDAIEVRAVERAREGDRGALDDVERLVKSPTANRLYNASCALAILGRTAGEPRFLARAVGLLESAFKAGFRPVHAAEDPDLSSLRGRADFEALMARYGAGVPGR